MRVCLQPDYVTDSVQGMYPQVRQLSAVKPVTFGDGCDVKRWWEREVWFLEDDSLGLEGWTGLADVKTQDFTEISDNDGAYMPTEQWLSSRVLTVHGVYLSNNVGSTLRMSSDFQRRCNALYGPRLKVIVTDEQGVRWCYGWLSSPPSYTCLDDYGWKVQLSITCPDPRKYSIPVVRKFDTKYWPDIAYNNMGDAPCPYTVSVPQACKNVDIVHTLPNGAVHHLKWTGDAQSLLLDSQTLVATGVATDAADSAVNPYTGMNGHVLSVERLYLMPGLNYLRESNGQRIRVQCASAWW